MKAKNPAGRFFLIFLMAAIIAPGLYYTGFADFLRRPPEKESNQKGGLKIEAPLKLPPSGNAENPFKTAQQKSQPPPLQGKSPWKEALPPPLSFADLKGRALSLESFRGRPLLLNFWASWCAPCWEEFPELIRAAEWAGGRLALLAVSKDSSKGEIKGFLRRLEKSEKIRWDREDVYVVWDKNGEIAEAFHALKLPETFILDKDLKIVWKKAGAFFFEEAMPLLSQILPPAAKPPRKL